MNVDGFEPRLWRALDDSPQGLERLVRDAVRYATNQGRSPVIAWSVVCGVFSVGSTHGAELCLRFGMDPDAMVRPGESVLRATESDGRPARGLDVRAGGAS